jgi:hypothetical protein
VFAEEVDDASDVEEVKVERILGVVAVADCQKRSRKSPGCAVWHALRPKCHIPEIKVDVTDGILPQTKREYVK